MAKTKEITKPYFSHDIFTRAQDEEIKNMFFYFRKTSTELAWSAYGVFWGIVEYLHHTQGNKLFKKDIDMLADDLRIEPEIIKTILTKFGLFEEKEDCYINNRVIRNLIQQEEKSQKAADSANKGWEKRKQLIDDIIDSYSKTFDKEFEASDENKKSIFSIINKNKDIFKDEPIEKWQKIFENAKRGWEFDGKKQIPDFKTILKKWDSFLNGEGYLAPDEEKIKNERAIKIFQDNELLKAKEDEDSKMFDLIIDRESAINYLQISEFVRRHDLENDATFKALSRKYQFTAKDVETAAKNA